MNTKDQQLVNGVEQPDVGAAKKYDDESLLELWMLFAALFSGKRFFELPGSNH